MDCEQIINNAKSTLEETEEELKDIRGHLYCLFNVMFKLYGGDDYYKLGKAFDVPKRLASYSTYYPEPSEMLEESAMLRNKHLAERVLFTKLAQFRDKQRREFFKCNRTLIKHTFGEIEETFAKYSDDQIAKIYNIKIKPIKKKNSVNNIDDDEDNNSNDSIDVEDNMIDDKDNMICEKDDSIESNNIYKDLDNNTTNIIICNGDVNIINKKISLSCEKCHECFNSPYYLNRHLKKKIPCVPEEREKRDIANRMCPDCKHIFSKPCVLKDHIPKCKFKPHITKTGQLKQLIIQLSNKLDKQCDEIKELKKKNKKK
jgi:hypothetical protein